MWPKRKKGKARSTKLKLKAMQPPDQQQGLQDGESEAEADEPQVELPQDPRAKQDDLVSGVWKSKVLTNYKQNPKNSHNLLARIPTGKAAFEAGERQKAELVKEAMIKVVDRMFDNFQNTAYEFNQVTAGTNLELTWIRPHFVQEEVSNWHETTRVSIEIFAGRISTRHWTLAVRGNASAVDTYILPSDKLLGFSTSPSSYPTYLSLVAECDGLSVNWIVANKTLDPEILPSVYRALLDGLIRFASEEDLPGETFRLEDIGIVPEAAAPTQEAVGYQSAQDKYDLMGQQHSSARNVIVSPVSSRSSADRFIDNISNQVAQAAQSETDKFRQSLQAPPFGTANRAPGDISQSGKTNSLQPNDLQQTPGFQQAPGFQQIEPENGDASHGFDDDDDGQWKSVASDQAVKADWRKFMETTKEQLKNAPAPPAAKDDSWNALPGTEKLARPDPRAASYEQAQMSNSQVMKGAPYPSYGNAADPPELLKPADRAPQPQSDQSGGYPIHPAASHSGVNSAQYTQPQSQRGISQSGVNSAQYAQPQTPQGLSQSGAYSTQPSGVFSGQQPQLPPQMPPQMMPPAYNPQMGMPQQQPPVVQPGMVNHPGLPSMPGMINPALGQSGVHQQPRLPEHYQALQPATPPQGMIAPPPGMIQMTPPQGMSPPAPVVPPQMVPGSMRLDDVAAQYAEQQRLKLHGQYNTGAQQAVPPQQYSTGSQRAVPQQYNSGGHQTMPPQPQHDTGRQQAVPQQYSTGFQSPQHNTGSQPAQYNTGSQPAVPQQYNTGSQPALPPQYNAGAQQSPAQYSNDAHLQLQYAQGGYNYNPPAQDAGAFQSPEAATEGQEEPYYVAPYLLSDSDGYAQEQYPTESEEYPAEEQDEEEGWQPDEESEEVAFEEGEGQEVSQEVDEPAWEEPANSPFAQPSFPQESFNELPVMSIEAVQKFEAASKAGFVFSSENDLVDAISVVLGTIDSQIELLTQQGTEAFKQRDFRRAESIIKLSERLTGFKAESQAILQAMSETE